MSSLSRKEFLYERKGPWPQPSPEHPLGDAPAVIHLPKQEVKYWQKHIGRRYDWNALTYWTKALWHALNHKHWDVIPDAEFEDMISNTPFSKFLRTTVEMDKFPSDDPNYDTPFREILTEDPDTQFFIMDFTVMKVIEPFKGLYAAPTMTLFRQVKSKKTKEVVAIYMNFSELLLTPEDGDAWTLAKYYVLQAASHRLVVSTHALLHFPFDCINAITKTSLPKSDTIFKLLYPHFELTLVLNNAVLESSTSPLVNNQKFPFNALTGHENGFRDMVMSDYSGIKLKDDKTYNPSYPPYQFRLEPLKVHSDYDTFLRAYYDVFLEFTTGVVDYIFKHQKTQLPRIKVWANYISQWLPGFPDGDVIHDKGILSKALALVMWDLSIGHAADHYNYSLLSVNKVLFRIRVAPPSSKDIPPFKQKDLNKWQDVFRQKMEHKMFFKPTNVSLLHNVDYNFEIMELDSLQQRFMQDLRDVEPRLKAQNVKIYIPFKEVSRSIQY